MDRITESELNRISKMLTVLGADFKIILDDVELGDLIVAKPKTSLPRGSYYAIYTGMFPLEADPGKYEVDLDDYDLEPEFDAGFRGALCNYLTKNWGEKSYRTHVERNTRKLTVILYDYSKVFKEKTAPSLSP